VHELDVGRATDIEVLSLSGSSVEDRGDHLIVRTPRNPTYHWGNCILVTDPEAVDDGGRWTEAFDAAFPAAGWIAIGLGRMPSDRAPWAASGLRLELNEVLTTTSLPRQTPAPNGYVVRRLAGEDWEQTVTLAVDDAARAGSWDPASFEAFARARAAITRALCDDGEIAAYFGAFADGVLAANLGIVCCGTTARFQTVLTQEAHRRRGLASHLLGMAAHWAGGRGCDRWVIVTETDNPAGRVYHAAGFERHASNVQAFRPRSAIHASPHA
jgi:GNAT superfamily N-acetyltransferase